MNINYYEKIKKVFILLTTKKKLLITNANQPAGQLTNQDGLEKYFRY